MIRYLPVLALAAQLFAEQPIEVVSTAPKPVEILVFSDFQCPFCAQFAAPIRELNAKGVEGVSMKLEFKQFPLSFHADSQLAHQAALGAGEQGKFWEMHDLLFANQSALKYNDLVRYAEKLHLDVARFKKDIDSDRLKQVVERDKADGAKRGVNGTPTFFVNGKEYTGTRSFDQLKQLVRDEQRRTRALAEIGEELMTKGSPNSAVTVQFFADLQSPVSRSAADR